MIIKLIQFSKKKNKIKHMQTNELCNHASHANHVSHANHAFMQKMI